MGKILSKDTSIKELYANYGSHHNEIVNKLIHIVCVPSIVWSILGMSHVARIPGAYIPILNITPTIAFPLIAHTLIPMYYNFPAGFMTLIMELLMAKSAENIFNSLGGGSTGFWFFFTTHAIGWLAQFYGHAFHEKREPKLISHPAAIFSAPTFVVLEVMFALGYNPKLKEECENLVAQYIQEDDEKKSKKNN